MSGELLIPFPGDEHAGVAAAGPLLGGVTQVNSAHHDAEAAVLDVEVAEIATVSGGLVKGSSMLARLPSTQREPPGVLVRSKRTSRRCCLERRSLPRNNTRLNWIRSVRFALPAVRKVSEVPMPYVYMDA